MTGSDKRFDSRGDGNLHTNMAFWRARTGNSTVLSIGRIIFVSTTEFYGPSELSVVAPYLYREHGVHGRRRWTYQTAFFPVTVQCSCHICEFTDWQHHTVYQCPCHLSEFSGQWCCTYIQHSGHLGNSQEPSLGQSMMQLLQAQTQILAAQAQAATVKSVSVPVCRTSDQQCLLDMNVVPLLGLKFTCSNGQPLRLQSNWNQSVA